MTDVALFRLEASADGGLGSWAHTDLDGGEPSSDDALNTGRLHAGPGEVYVSNRYGGTVSFVPVGGCPAN